MNININVSKNVLIDIDIFKSDLIDINIFKTCRYIENRYGLSIYPTPLHLIDELHLQNHKNERCQELYNPKRLKMHLPDANLTAAEQIFCWQSRFKKILSSMRKTTFLFTLHRLVKARNRYTLICHRDGRKPVLPSVRMPRNTDSE